MHIPNCIHFHCKCGWS